MCLKNLLVNKKTVQLITSDPRHSEVDRQDQQPDTDSVFSDGDVENVVGEFNANDVIGAKNLQLVLVHSDTSNISSSFDDDDTESKLVLRVLPLNVTHTDL